MSICCFSSLLLSDEGCLNVSAILITLTGLFVGFDVGGLVGRNVGGGVGVVTSSLISFDNSVGSSSKLVFAQFVILSLIDDANDVSSFGTVLSSSSD